MTSHDRSLLEARLIAVTRAREVVEVAQRADSPKAAVPLIMAAFGLTEVQAAAVLDTPFSAVTAWRSPPILSVAWGRMDVDGLPEGKDFMLYPGGGREWDWNENGTRHEPGVQPVDVEELLRRGASVVVLSRGMELRLQVDPRTTALLEERGVPVHVAETTEAVRIYNELAADRAVGGLFHSTC